MANQSIKDAFQQFWEYVIGKVGAHNEDASAHSDIREAAGAGVKSMVYNSSANKWTVTLMNDKTIAVDGPSVPDVSGYMPKSGGTFTGAVKTGTAATGEYYVRNIKFSDTAETPTNEGDICFKLK